MDSIKRLLLANQAWIQEKISMKPDFFTEIAKDQQPEFLWIGCSDSRVPAEDITGTEPGEIFVHRNVANIVHYTDLNLLSVTQYAVEYLKVKHIIVCGHTGCGGVRASMTHQSFGSLNKWLRTLKDVYQRNHIELELLSMADDRRLNRLVELNVMEQVQNLAKTSIVQQSWYKSKAPKIHGWVYDMKTGLIRDIVEMDHTSKLDDIYRFDEDSLS
jgi:carbonic anhydrase